MKKAKIPSLEDFIVALECEVVEFNLKTSNTVIRPVSEMVFGSKSSSYKGGQCNSAYIKIKSDECVQQLVYGGSCFLEAGDKIKAYIIKAEEVQGFHLKTNIYDHGWHTSYKKRCFIKEENVIKIEKLKGNKVIATYYL